MAPLVIFFLPSSFKCLGFFQWSKEKKSGNLKKILQLGHPFSIGKKNEYKCQVYGIFY